MFINKNSERIKTIKATHHLVVSGNLVIIPTYNEKENIINIIDAVFSLEMPFHILIVDDGSPDGTAQMVKNHQLKHPNSLFLIERKGKLGLGTAYINDPAQRAKFQRFRQRPQRCARGRG